MTQTALKFDEQASKADRDFLDFHERNPHVYARLVQLAREAKAVGHRRIGIQMLWEVLRWERLKTQRAEGDYKLNNNHTARYARLIMARETDLRGFFETREMRRSC